MLIMKVICTLKNATLFTLILLIVVSLAGSAQAPPDYLFKNSTLISGTNKEVGATYRFPASKPGVDAIVLINFISPGVRIVDFDDN